jgi:hypothetical protein
MRAKRIHTEINNKPVSYTDIAVPIIALKLKYSSKSGKNKIARH